MDNGAGKREGLDDSSLENIKEKCGVIAVATAKPLSEIPNIAYSLLKKLQHRGQDGAGFSFYDSEKKGIKTYKDFGSVDEIFRRLKLHELEGDFSRAIGHVRYRTSGALGFSGLQPQERTHDRYWKWFSFAFNGNVANFEQLKREIEEIGEKYEYRDTENDTDVIKVLLSRENKGDSNPGLKQIFSNTSKKIDGSYSLVYLNAHGELAILRDPQGFMPLFYAYNDDLFVAASENSALSLFFPEEEIFELLPGEIVTVGKDFIIRKDSFAESKKKSYCMFQYVYFMSPASKFNKASVATVRRELGRRLALADPLRNMDKADFIVVPIPDSAFSAAYSYAETLGIPVVEGMKKNELVGRNFIMPSQTVRESAIKIKHDVISDVVRGKNVILVDDSLVRGTTSRNRIKQLKQAGAKSIHLRFTCPPIISPCFYGIDFPSEEELEAYKFSHLTLDQIDENVASDLGANSVHYQNISDLKKAIIYSSGGTIKEEDLCLACLNKDYPTPAGRDKIKFSGKIGVAG